MEQEGELSRARKRLIEALAQQSAFWGLGRMTGQLYAVLYLSPRPLSLGELAGALGVTKGSVSVAVRPLEQLGMVRRHIRPGDRRAYFEAEADFWEIARAVLERRQKPEFDRSFRLVEEGVALARQAPAGEERAFVLDRLSALQRFYGDLDAIAATLLRLGPHRLPTLAALAARWLPRRGGKPNAADGEEEQS